MVNYSHEKFISDVQYFELIKDLIIRNTEQTYKSAFYLADQCVEIFMFRLLKARIVRDSELVAILQPEIDQEKITDINRYYEMKIKWLKRLKLINSTDAERIRFLHVYRNLSYHNEVEDAGMFPILVSLSLSSALKLFKTYYSISLSETYFGSKAVLALKKYSLPTDKINYKFASQTIVKELNKKLLKKTKIEKLLKANLRHRLKIISGKRSELSWLKNDYVFDIWIKTAEFFDVHPYDGFSKRVYEMHYEIIRRTKDGKKIKEKASTALYKKKILRETARDKKISKLLTAYRQSVSSNSIRLANNFLKEEISNLSVFLTRYERLDKQIRKLEFLVEKIREDFDREVQREIDCSRGK